jgi:4-alpha-glucanotransferase
MSFPRASGILLHPTSLPGRFGIGDLGGAAYEFVDFLAASGQSLWQVLPLGPTGYGDSPYQCFSAFAGSGLLISLEGLVKEGWLAESDVASPPDFSPDRVDYGRVMEVKRPLLWQAYDNFKVKAKARARAEFASFCEHAQAWLEDYAFFRSIKEAHQGRAWTQWDPHLRRREEKALWFWGENHRREIEGQQFFQYIFFKQWLQLARYANERGVKLIGDVPIFVAHDSADVWAHPELFYLDEEGQPEVVAGVPPDYFSETGQLWGNPLYRWDVMAETDYQWWVERIRADLSRVDIIRLDHFRGFESYWEVPGGETTAANGQWVPGPGAALFEAVQRKLGELPIIAEDLGVITPEVEALRDHFGFPGMRILQFAFSPEPAADESRPYNFPPNCVVYTGTHDNDTAVGWFTSAGAGETTRSTKQTQAERAFALKYLGTDGREIHWDFIRLALSSVARLAIIPLQDVLGLGNEARMNKPARPTGNWTWRYRAEMLTEAICDRLGELTAVYGRASASAADEEPGAAAAAEAEA